MDLREQMIADIAARTGIDEPMIDRLVRRFYAKIRTDALLGPVFDARIRDWEPHLQRMCAFWSSVALMSGRYHGSPMTKHLPLPVDAAHFDRWLELFEETAREVCPPVAAEHFIERARGRPRARGGRRGGEGGRDDGRGHPADRPSACRGRRALCHHQHIYYRL